MTRKLYTGDPADRCPYMGGKLCVKVCPTCKFQQQYTGVNPNTGETVPTWECSITMMTILLMENSKNTFRVGSAIESFRNETVEQQRALLSGTIKIAEKVINGASQLAIADVKQIES